VVNSGNSGDRVVIKSKKGAICGVRVARVKFACGLSKNEIKKCISEVCMYMYCLSHCRIISLGVRRCSTGVQEYRSTGVQTGVRDRKAGMSDEIH
jgi:hypothetical protein